MLTRRQKRTELPNLTELFAPLEAFVRIGIAVSGGPDSVALMVLVARWAMEQKSPPSLFVYCVDHGLRSAACEETAFVAREAEKLNIPARVLMWEGDKPETGLMAAARIARYRLIGAAMKKDRVEILLTGHHAHDQAETILMRLAHGSGLGGLGGMNMFSTVENVKICRPLLQIPPASLRQVVEEIGIVAVADPSNKDDNFERVRWRQMLPKLADMDLDANRFLLFAKRIRRAEHSLAEQASKVFSKYSQIDGFGVVRIDRQEFDQQSDELKVRMVQKALRIAGGEQKPFSLGPIEELVAQMAGEQAIVKQTLLGCVIEQRGPDFVFAREPSRVSADTTVLTPGKTIEWDNRFIIKNLADTQNIEITSGACLTRAQIKKLLNDNRQVLMAHVHGAPVIIEEKGEILAIGCHVLAGAKGLEISQIRGH